MTETFRLSVALLILLAFIIANHVYIYMLPRDDADDPVQLPKTFYDRREPQ